MANDSPQSHRWRFSLTLSLLAAYTALFLFLLHKYKWVSVCMYVRFRNRRVRKWAQKLDWQQTGAELFKRRP